MTLRLKLVIKKRGTQVRDNERWLNDRKRWSDGRIHELETMEGLQFFVTNSKL